MALALSDADLDALITLLRETIAADRSPLSPHIRALKHVLDKLEQPPPNPSGEGSLALNRKRRR